MLEWASRGMLEAGLVEKKGGSTLQGLAEACARRAWVLEASKREKRTMRIGELLVRQGVLTPGQVEQVLAEQTRCALPFGSICEQLFGVSPEIVESCWVEQYTELTGSLIPNFDDCDPSVLNTLTRRQAWQFRVVPLRWEEGALLLATTSEHLQRALRFATQVIPVPVFFVITDADDLGNALSRYYPIPGLNASSVRGELEDFFSSLKTRGSMLAA